MERIRAAVDLVPLPPGAEQVKGNLESLWTQRSWPAARGFENVTDADSELANAGPDGSTATKWVKMRSG